MLNLKNYFSKAFISVQTFNKYPFKKKIDENIF